MSELRKTPIGDIAIGDFIVLLDEWDQYLLSKYSRETVKAYNKALHKFQAWLSGGKFRDLQPRGLSEVTPAEVQEWREHLLGSYSTSTVNLWLTGVRRFYAWLIEKGALIHNPAEGVKGASRAGESRQHKRDELTASEVRSVLDTCDDTDLGRRDRAMLSLMAYCALRAVEVQRADLEDLRSKEGRMSLGVHGEKDGEANDVVMLPAPAEVALSAWLVVRGEAPGPLFHSLSRQNHGDRLSRRAIRGMVKQRFRDAGVLSEGKTTHSLRHSAITSAIRHGATPLQVQSMARLRSFETTLRYFHRVRPTDDRAEDLVAYEEKDGGPN